MKVLITIEGPAGAGKSTLASAIAELLREAGITTFCADDVDRRGVGVLGLRRVDPVTFVEIVTTNVERSKS